MTRDTTRRGFLLAAGGGALTTLAGCTGDGEQTTTSTGDGGTETGDGDAGTGDTAATSPTPTPESTDGQTSSPADTGGTLRMAASGAIQTLDPINAKGSGAGYDQYGRSLLEFPNGLYPPKPALAKSYSVSDDGLTYTFQLREDVTFHDGTEFTASDVVYSWERLAQSKYSRNKDDVIGETMTIEHEKDKSRTKPTDEATLEDYVPGSLAVRAPDSHTFEFTLRRPFKYTLSQIAGGAFAVLPENSVGDIEREGIDTDGTYDYNEFFGTKNGGPKYAGLGPFEVDSWTKGSQLQLSAFDDYYGEGPQIDGITYTVLTSGNARLNRFRNGNLDILEGVPTADFNPSNVSIEEELSGGREVGTYEFGDGSTVNYGRITALSTEYLVFNCDRVPRPVRRAFAYLINQHDIAKNVYKGLATPGYHITPPAAYPTFEDGVTPQETYDRHAESGYESTTEFGADGWPYGYGETRIEDAKRVMEEAGYGSDNRFSVTATTISGDSGYKQVLTTLQAKARSAYIDVEITEANFGAIISKAISGDMDMFALGDGMEYPGPQNFLRFLHAGNPGTSFTRWGSKDKSKWNEYMKTADRAWKQQYIPNTGSDSKSARRARAEAFQTVEEMNWASVQELPTVHPVDQRFWGTDVNVDMYGVMENQTFTDLTLSR